jgi:hypothetical protein
VVLQYTMVRVIQGVVYHMYDTGVSYCSLYVQYHTREEALTHPLLAGAHDVSDALVLLAMPGWRAALSIM